MTMFMVLSSWPKSLWEFTQFMWWMQTERRVAANPQTKPIDLGCESAENWQVPSTSTIAIDDGEKRIGLVVWMCSVNNWPWIVISTLLVAISFIPFPWSYSFSHPSFSFFFFPCRHAPPFLFYFITLNLISLILLHLRPNLTCTVPLKWLTHLLH